MSLAFIIGRFVTTVPACSMDTRKILDGRDIITVTLKMSRD